MKAPDGTVLITGANGFIGCRVVECFFLDGLFDLKAGIHRWSSATRVGRLPVDLVQLDITDPSSVAGAMEGVRYVVHCALGPPPVIVDGTKNMLESALRNKVDRFVHLSTVQVYGGAEGEITEEWPRQREGDEYGDSKVEAEELCCAYHKRGVPVVMLRPTIVYGPFAKNYTVRYFDRLVSGEWGTLGRFGEGICNLVYVDDVVQAIRLALTRAEGVGQSFNINGPERITWNQYFTLFNAALDLPSLREIELANIQVKAWFTQRLSFLGNYMLAHHLDTMTKVYRRSGLAKRMMDAMEQKLRTALSPGDIKLYSTSAYYPSLRAERLLGYQAAFHSRTGLRLTTEWLHHQGYVAAALSKRAHT